MVAIDTDVLVLALAFHRDERQTLKTAFLETARIQTPIVAIYSVMELLGQLSFTFSRTSGAVAILASRSLQFDVGIPSNGQPCR